MASKQTDGNRQREPDKLAAEQAAERETQRLLLGLVRAAVPPVPRKLNLIGELYGLYLGIAAGNGWHMKEAREKLTLMRLVILQILAPNLSRFGRRNPAFLLWMENWTKRQPGLVNLGHLEEAVRDEIIVLEEKLKANSTDLQSANTLHTLRRKHQPLLSLIREAQHQRNDFDPFRLINQDNPCDSALSQYYTLQKRITDVVRESYFVADDMPGAAPTDPEGFFSQLFSTDRIAWQNAIEQEAETLAGHILDDKSFQTLLDMVSRSPDFISMDWLECLEPYLSAQQLSQIVKTSGLLVRLNEQIQGGD